MKTLTLSEMDKISAIKLEILEGGSLESYIFHRSTSLSRSYRYKFRERCTYLYDKFLANDKDVLEKIEFKKTLNDVLNIGKVTK